MNCLRRCLSGLFITTCIVLGIVALLLGFAAHWLLDPGLPIKADAIIVLAGDARRARHAGDLFLQGYSSQILVSRPAHSERERMLDELGIVLPRGEEIDIRVLEQAGVPRDQIAIFGTASLSTFEEGKVLGGLYAGTSPRLLVVTSPYHVRRARMILESALPTAQISVVATPYEAFPERWWTSQDAARDLLLEIAKLTFYGVGGRFTSSGQ